MSYNDPYLQRFRLILNDPKLRRGIIPLSIQIPYLKDLLKPETKDMPTILADLLKPNELKYNHNVVCSLSYFRKSNITSPTSAKNYQSETIKKEINQAVNRIEGFCHKMKSIESL